MKHAIISEKNIFKLIVILAAVVYSITAFNSHGFYHADEQYQIIEFAGFKLGTHSPDELAWEFNKQIRPSLQPVIGFVVLKACNIFNLNNPYNQAFVLRLLSALFAIIVISIFVRSTTSLIKNRSVKTAYYLLSYFLWFIPVISVRFSSETWSGLMFLLSLALFLNNSNHKLKPFLIGFTLGLSFLFRFQIAFAIIGFVLWLIVIDHSKPKYLLKIFASICAVLFFGVLLDSWYYGEFVSTPWNYLLSVIASGGDGFGTSPWHYYIFKFLSYPSYFMGIPLLLSIVLTLIFKPDSLMLWCIIPFVLIHSFVPHKEERFLFPIVYFFPLLLIEAYTIVNRLITKRGWIMSLNIVLIVGFILINLVGLIAMGQKSAGIGRMEITKYIHDNYGDHNINLVFCSWANPYNPWHSLPVKFYLEDSLTEHRVNNLCEVNDSLFIKDAVNLLVIRKIDKEKIECSRIIDSDNFIFETQSVPEWIEKINVKYKGFENSDILELYRYTNSELE
jgi:phosphatidylinositol glycan class B